MRLTVEEVQNRFPAFESELVNDIVRVADVKSFDKGEYVLRKGQYIRSMLILFDGLVKVSRENGNGSYFFMNYVTGGQAFVITLLYGDRPEPSELSACAAEKTIFLAIPLTCMEKWMKEYKSWYQYVIDSARERVKDLLRMVDNIVFHNMDERLILYLNYHSEVLQTKKIPITRTEIAREFNSSREVITRVLNKLAAKGRLRMHRHHVEILNLS
jgi:CRP/FNR family transcriptional regulator, anaerobic regulatory protein